MKFLLAILLVAGSLAEDADDTHAGLRSRKLVDHEDLGVFFLENNSRFSQTALVKKSGGRFEIELRAPEHSTFMSDELWTLQADGKVRSILEPRLCWKVDASSSRLGVTDCDTASGPLVTFNFDDIPNYEDATGRIKVGNNCLAEPDNNEGTIVSADCQDWDRFHWQPRSIKYFTLYGIDNGCIVPDYFENAVRFASCDYPNDANFISNWWQDNTGLIHSRLAPGKCLQVAYGDLINDGSKMRFSDCNKNKATQKFEDVKKSGNIKLKSRSDLCVVAQGSPPTKDVSEIIVKKCSVVGNNRATWRAPAL